MRGSDSAWVVRHARSAARLRLLCFPFAGGGASAFRAWADRLPTDVEVCALQLPGRETRLKEAPRTQLSELVLSLADATEPYRDMAYAFFGHSLGGLIAFELTRALRSGREELPRALIVSACAAPQLTTPELALSRLSNETLLTYLRRFEGTPLAIYDNAELLELILPTLRADFALRDGYHYAAEPPLALPIVAFGGRDDAHVPHPELAGWRTQTTHEFALHQLAGGHFFFRSAPDPFFAALRAVLSSLGGHSRAGASLFDLAHPESP